MKNNQIEYKTPYEQFWAPYQGEDGLLRPGLNYFDIRRRLMQKVEKMPKTDMNDVCPIYAKDTISCACGAEVSIKHDLLAEETDYICTIYLLCPKCHKVGVVHR